MVLAVCLAGVVAVTAQLRCVDAAREAARLAARGDERTAVAAARRIAPRGAAVGLHRERGFVVATVTARAAGLPGVVLGADSVAAVEPG